MPQNVGHDGLRRGGPADVVKDGKVVIPSVVVLLIVSLEEAV